jgi:hypothetical protein
VDYLVSEGLEDKIDLKDLDDLEKNIHICSVVYRFSESGSETWDVLTGTFVGISVDAARQALDIEMKIDVSNAHNLLKSAIRGVAWTYDKCMLNISDEQEITLDVSSYKLVKFQVLDVSSNSSMCTLLLAFERAVAKDLPLP